MSQSHPTTNIPSCNRHWRSPFEWPNWYSTTHCLELHCRFQTCPHTFWISTPPVSSRPTRAWEKWEGDYLSKVLALELETDRALIQFWGWTPSACWPQCVILRACTVVGVAAVVAHPLLLLENGRRRPWNRLHQFLFRYQYGIHCVSRSLWREVMRKIIFDWPVKNQGEGGTFERLILARGFPIGGSWAI